MENVVTQKTAKHVEWSVNFRTFPSASPSFYLQNRKCYLELVSDCLYLKCDKHLQMPLLKVIVHVCCVGGMFTDSSVQTISSSNTCIRIYERDSGSFGMNSYEFLITFIHDAEASENDKYVRTESDLITKVSMESLSKDLSELLASESTYDAEVKCGEQTVKAHKMILSVRSEVLKAMFESDMLEGRTGIIEIKDMDAHYLQDFIKYLYTGSLSDMTFDKATCLYETGDKYAIKCLMFRCSEYLQNNLSPKIVCQCLALADSHVDKELKDIATKYILDEKIYLEDELWLPFCDSFPKLAIEVYRLSVTATQNNNV